MPYIKNIIRPVPSTYPGASCFSHPRLSADGAQKGLLLWFNTVFPTLFPFDLLKAFS